MRRVKLYQPPQEGEWDGVKCVPIVSIGAYVGDGVAGLLLDVQALMLGERTVVPPIDFSFLGRRSIPKRSFV